ncbi:hypothetical protein DL93DRAFT_1705524 [Clavulina sp. PMI_390]|nr:hypothetical protein DL93DRAFT_1705524 [Clavulina sp. PMI_390]
MSAMSSPPPSSTSFAFVDGESVNTQSAAASPPPSTIRESQYLYYRLYQDGGPLGSYRKFGPDDNERSELIGRLLVDDIPPPRTIRNLKRYIARLEGFIGPQVEDILLSSASREGEEDTTFLEFSTYAPGCDFTHPVHVIILDGARRTLPGRLPPSISGYASSPSRLSTSSRTIFHQGVFWNVDAYGFGEPRVDPDCSWTIVGAANPPGWTNAHIKSPSLAPMVYRIAEDRAPDFYGGIDRSHSLLVDSRTTITTSDGGEFYRAIWLGRIILLVIDEVVFDQQ